MGRRAALPALFAMWLVAVAACNHERRHAEAPASASTSTTDTASDSPAPPAGAKPSEAQPTAHDGVTVAPAAQPNVAVEPASSSSSTSPIAVGPGSKKDQIKNGSARAAGKPGEGWEQFKHDTKSAVKDIGDGFK